MNSKMLRKRFIQETFLVRIRKMRKKILITGGAGYIGSHVAKQLLEQGYDIIILTQTASCKYGLKVALDSIKSRGRRDYGARYYNSLLFN